MAIRRLNLTRDQLASFLQEHEQIRQFELLFAAVDELQTTGIDAVTYDAGAALAGVNKLAGVIADLAQSEAVSSSTALAIAEAAQRALAAIEHAAMMAVTAQSKCCEPTTAELLGSVEPPNLCVKGTEDKIGAVVPPAVITPTTAELFGAVAPPGVATPTTAELFGAVAPPGAATLTTAEVMGAVAPPLVVTPTTAELLGATAPPRVHMPSNAELMGAFVPPRTPWRRIVGAWHDMSRQIAVGVNAGTRMLCGSIDIQRGAWRDPGSDVFYVADAGIYNIEFSAQLDRNKGTDSEVWIWLSVNGAYVPESASVIRVKGNNAESVASWNWLVELRPGGSFSIMWATDDLDTYLETFAASAFAPAVPSVIITITQEA